MTQSEPYTESVFVQASTSLILPRVGGGWQSPVKLQSVSLDSRSLPKWIRGDILLTLRESVSAKIIEARVYKFDSSVFENAEQDPREWVSQ